MQWMLSYRMMRSQWWLSAFAPSNTHFVLSVPPPPPKKKYLVRHWLDGMATLFCFQCPQFRCIIPKIGHFFFFCTSVWSKQMSLTQNLKWWLEVHYNLTFSTASNWFVTLYYKLFSQVSLASKHVRQRSSPLLIRYIYVQYCTWV